MGVLKFIFFALVGIWFVGLILRATFSRFLRKNAEAYNRAVKNAQREAQREARQKGRREGEVTVEATESSVAKRVSRDVGDYVEFEEVKE